MANYLQILWQRLFAQDVIIKIEIERIAALQQAAAERRAEYAAEQAAQASDAPIPTLPSSSRRRMEEAEAAHAVALRTWENRQSRQRSH